MARRCSNAVDSTNIPAVEAGDRPKDHDRDVEVEDQIPVGATLPDDDYTNYLTSNRVFRNDLETNRVFDRFDPVENHGDLEQNDGFWRSQIRANVSSRDLCLDGYPNGEKVDLFQSSFGHLKSMDGLVSNRCLRELPVD